MDDGWSPRLIAEVSACDHRGDKLMQVSHETIYQCLYVQTRGSLRADLHKRLSTKRSARKPRGTPAAPAVYTPGIFTISDRPAEAADRAVPGHWEGDLILGAQQRTAIGTLVSAPPGSPFRCTRPPTTPPRPSPAAMIDADGRTARTPAPIHHLGPRQRNGLIRQDIQLASLCPGVLLQSALTVAARHQREHQSPAAVLV